MCLSTEGERSRSLDFDLLSLEDDLLLLLVVVELLLLVVEADVEGVIAVDTDADTEAVASGSDHTMLDHTMFLYHVFSRRNFVFS